MSLVIITDKTKVTGVGTGVVVIEGDAPDEVNSLNARRMALEHAGTLGISRPGLGVGGGSYLVDEAGEPATTIPPGVKYRFDHAIQGGL